MDLFGPGDAAAGWVAARQREMITAAQLQACGLGAGALRGRVRRKLLLPMGRGVFHLGAKDVDSGGLAMSAVLGFEPGAVLSHESAAHELGLLRRAPPTVHVTIVCRNPGAAPEVTVHRVRHLATNEATWRSLLPVTGPVRTLIDMAKDSARSSLEVALRAAMAEGVATARQIEQAVALNPGRRGIGPLRRLLQAGEGALRTRSEAERLYAQLIRDAGMPSPELNVPFEDYELDAYWADAGLAVELDGFEFHGGREAFEADRRRDAKLKAAGVEVLRFTWRQIVDEPQRVVADTARVFTRRELAAQRGKVGDTAG